MNNYSAINFLAAGPLLYKYMRLSGNHVAPMIFLLGSVFISRLYTLLVAGPKQNQTETNHFEGRTYRFSLFSGLKSSARRAMPLSHEQLEYFMYSTFSRDSNGTEPKIDTFGGADRIFAFGKP